jgi:23S rRNA (pseudouridine1915-N3)-methyltransferase
MKIRIVALGHKMPAWVETAFDDYTRRMPPEARIELIELKPEDRASRSVDQVLAKEAERIEATIPKGATRIVLDERGRMITTKEFAAWFASWQREGESPVFLIGSVDGLAPSIKSSAAKTIALSGGTLPHALVRVLLVEQLYRAWSLSVNHPYHRE